jgi:hypothetical protein
MYLINYKPIGLPLQTGVRPFKTSSLIESILFHNNLTKKAFLNTMINAAKLRQNKRKKSITIKFNEAKNVPVVYATRNIEANEVVYQ